MSSGWRIRFRAVSKSPLVLLRGHKSPHLLRALTQLSPTNFDPKNRVLFLLSWRFLWNFVRFLKLTRRPQQAATLAFLRAADTRVICTMENYDKILEQPLGLRWSSLIRRYLPHIHFVKVQHGQDLRRNPVGAKTGEVLAVWGQFSADWFPTFGRTESHFVVTGALQDSRYRSLVASASIHEKWDYCIVSTVKSQEWWGPVLTTRRSGYEKLMSFVAASTGQSTLAIALTVDRFTIDGENQAQLEREYFLNHFGDRCHFPEVEETFGGVFKTEHTLTSPTSHKERFSSYALTDASRVTIGATGSVLWEAFGRGNRILAVNLTDDPAYDFPIPGPWSMRQPSIDQFAERLQWITDLSDDQYFTMSNDAARYLMHYEEEDPPEMRLQRLVASLLENESLATAKEVWNRNEDSGMKS